MQSTGTITRLLLGLIVTCCIAFGQDARGRVQGLVTDSTQARILGAKVVLTNINTGVATSKSTGETGQYLFDYVDPGMYTLAAEMEGFSRFVQRNVDVQVRGDVTVNIVMQLGATSQSLVVQDTPPSVQFNTGTMDVVVDREMINDLPSIGRNPYLLATLDPAVILEYGDANNAAPYRMWYGSSLDVGGSTSQKNDLLLDGTPSQVGAKASYQPPMDAVQEFSVQQNAVDAEFGHSAGGTISVSMRSGTNQHHGTLYYYGRNPLLNAVSNATVRTPNMVHSHMWGATGGGPIKKNKLFTFIAYEGWKYGTPQSMSETLPTVRERTGDYSQSLNTSGGLRTIYDPFSTTTSASGAVSRQPFAGNIIPANRIDPTAARMMKEIWQPNNPGTGPTASLNYRQAFTWLNHYRNLSDRSDWNISDKWKLFGRYSRFDTVLQQPDFTQSKAVYNPLDGQMNSRNYALDSVYTISPTMVLNVRWSYTALNDSYDSPTLALSQQQFAAYWGGNAWLQPYMKDMPALYFPYLNFNSSASTFSQANYWIQHPHTYSYFARLSRQQGSHYLKVGTDDRFIRSNAVRPKNVNLYFSPTDTANTYLSPNTRLAGDAYASFLLGVMNPSSSFAQDIPIQQPMVNSYSFYIQDDYKLNRRITLNLGLRYEYEPGPYDPQNRLSRYLDLTSPIPEMQSTPPKMPADVAAMMGRPWSFTGAWIFADGGNRHMWQSDPHVFLPRIGVAVRLGDKSALRAGFARYVTPPITGTDMLGSMSYPGYSASTYIAPTLQGVPGAVLNNPFPSTNPLILPSGNSLGRYTNLGGGATWDQQNMRTATNDRLDVTLQRQLPGRVSAEVAFFENFGHNWAYTQQLNMMDPSLSYKYQAALNKSIPNPFYMYSTADKFPGQLRNQANVSVSSLLVPYPQYGGLTQTNTAGVQDRYRSLKIKAQRRFANGFNFLAAYNYNNEKTTGFFNSDAQYANDFTWMPGAMPRHRLNASGTYQLPFGKGRRLLSHPGVVVQGLLGGWATSGILTYVSGDYLQFGSYLVKGDPGISDPNRDHWFNTAVFSFLPSYTERLNPHQYADVRGPRRMNGDMTLMKSFPIKETYRLEFRMEAYNVTNSFMAADPSTSLSDPNFGKSVNQRNYGRSMQYCLKLYF